MNTKEECGDIRHEVFCALSFKAACFPSVTDCGTADVIIPSVAFCVIGYRETVFKLEICNFFCAFRPMLALSFREGLPAYVYVADYSPHLKLRTSHKC